MRKEIQMITAVERAKLAQEDRIRGYEIASILHGVKVDLHSFPQQLGDRPIIRDDILSIIRRVEYLIGKLDQGGPK